MCRINLYTRLFGTLEQTYPLPAYYMNLPLQVGFFFLHYSLTKPADFTECVGDELPVGWEQAYDYHRGGIYYVDHRNRNELI